ncbi:4-(cytidine 5'-diphospho)-2-C-methyl-D-erythritol kinase [Niabella aquatica]
MIVFSNCKINIGLYITQKRADGYHNLETVFLPLPLFDVIELMEAGTTTISILGQPVPGKIADNIILNAWELLKKDFPSLPPVHFYLLKNIPVGSGLGAGSANGAYTLMALNNKFRLNLSTDQLISYALRLGSDCPFFIKNKPSFASGRGEIFEEVAPDLSGYKIVMVNPGVHISTPLAFSYVQPKPAPVNLKEAVSRPVEEWKKLITNDFEEAVIKRHSEIGTIKQSLYNMGADFALMSGSGSTVYGLFKKDTDIILNFPDNYFVKMLDL